MESKIEKKIFNLMNAYAIASKLPEGNPNEAKLKSSEMAMCVNSLVDLFNTQPQTEEKEVNQMYDFNERKVTTYIVDKDKVITILRQDEMPEWLKKGDVRVFKDTPEEKYKKGDKVKLTLADKDGWVAGEFEVAGVEVEQPEEKKTLEQIREEFDKERIKEWNKTAVETYKQATQDTPEELTDKKKGIDNGVDREDTPEEKEDKKKVEGLLIAEKLSEILTRHKIPIQDSESLLIGDEILNLFYEELDRAREEGKLEVLEELLGWDTPLEEKVERLSKLTTK